MEEEQCMRCADAIFTKHEMEEMGVVIIHIPAAVDHDRSFAGSSL